MNITAKGAICGYCGKRLRDNELFHPECRRNSGVAVAPEPDAEFSNRREEHFLEIRALLKGLILKR